MTAPLKSAKALWRFPKKKRMCSGRMTETSAPRRARTHRRIFRAAAKGCKRN